MALLPNDDNRITYFAETDARGKRLKFGIKAKDRTRHVYVIGKTGMGKSTLLENMAVQDIQNGEGMCFIDPHGKTADLMLEYVPKERIRDVIYIAPFDTDYPISFNVLESVDPAKRHLVVSGLMSTFKKIWEDAWSARMEYILTNTLLALLEYPGSTLLGVNRMLSDKEYRKDVVAHITDPSVRAFWVKEFANYTERMAAEAVPSIQNKVGQFTANPLIRNMIGQPTSSFDFRQAMDSRKIIIINLSKGRIGDENMKLLGGLLVTKIYLAAMSRADLPDRTMKVMPNFYLFVDEFQNFANASFADILSEARKYKLNLTIAHQYIEQMDEAVRPAVFGNVGTMMVFRVGATDAEELEKEFAPQFTIEDLVNLGFAQIYLKLMIDGLSSSPFSATTLPPIAHPDVSYVKEIISASREQFAHPRAAVEAEIIKFHESMPVAKAGAASASSAVKKISSAAPAADLPPIIEAPMASVASKPPAAKPKLPAQAIQPSAQALQPAPKIASITQAVQIAPATPSPAPIGKSVKKVDEFAYVAKTTTTAAAPKPPVTKPTIEPGPSLGEAIKEALMAAKAAPRMVPLAPPQAAPTAPGPSATPVAPKPAPQNIAPVVRPVSLSSLAPKAAQPKQDPKAASPQNVNDLRNALAAVLGKEKVAQASAPKPSAPQPQVKPPQPQPSVQPPKEVPEDLLKKVLDIK